MSLNTQYLQPIINFLWTVADDVLVNTYQKGKYKDVILPMVVIRRLDLLLEPSKEQVLKTFGEYKDKLQNLDSLLTNSKHGSGLAFYNTSPFTLKKLLQDPKNLRSNFENYLNGFSENVQDIIKQFKFRNEIETLDEADILFSLIEKFCSPKVELHPDKLPPLAMGYVYEDLVRRFNEENNEEAGEHFTPREIIDLMTHLVFLPVKDKIQQGTYLVYDPCVGSGGMLTIAKNFILNPDGLIKSKSTVHLYGQESTPFIYATCKSDMLIKGEDPNKIAYGSTLSAYGFDNDLKFDFMLTNPPYGKTWAPDKKALSIGEKGKIIDKRFRVGTSRVNDGQLMFVLHMLSKMKDTELGSRIASVHNGSALFTGDAGQGESEIRKHIMENDLLEAIVALPNDMFYNTGIPTYIFLFTNRKAKHRKGKVQLINATSEKFYYKMRKPLGKKRVEFSIQHIPVIEKMFLDFEENEYSKIFDNKDFGYYQITVNRPERDENGNIVYASKGKPKADSKLKDTENIPLKEDIQEFFEREVLPFAPDLPAQTPVKGEFCIYVLKCADGSFYKGQTNDFDRRMEEHRKGEVSWTSKNLPFEITHWEVFATRDEAVQRENYLKSGRGRAWLQKMYDEKKLKIFERQAGAWWDEKDTKIGYEINFAKYFYKYQPPRALTEIAKDIFAIEQETEGLLKEIIE
ncbi:MAG: N-6 DNA methylase [Bacteroidetes bacterium]|nr:N-6 DNA methylase [Bacteroidota bacterium]